MSKKFPSHLKLRSSQDHFDKYEYYLKSVQSPDGDAEFLFKVYKDQFKKNPISLREDFCGTHALSVEWVKLNPKNAALGVDLDPEPIEYGNKNYVAALKEHEKARIKTLQSNVLTPLPQADLIAAMNFSHYIFKKREEMALYMHNCFAALPAKGLLIMDAFGGSACQLVNEESTKHRNFTYYWDQKSFDPITNFAEFQIHFKINGQKKRLNVFNYQWRMWSLPELKELMLSTGFQKAVVYWEGTTKSGQGNGIYKEAQSGEECLAWVAYVVGVKGG